MDLFKNLEEVISLWEVSGRSTVLRVLNEVSARIGNTFWELVIKVEGTQARAIFGGAVSKEVIFSLLSEMEKTYSGTVGAV
jgi:hypothetical protein